MVVNKAKLVETLVDVKTKPIKFIQYQNMVFIGRYDEVEKKLYDVLMVIIKPPQVPQDKTTITDQLKIEYSLVPTFFGLGQPTMEDIQNPNYKNSGLTDFDLSNADYIVFEPKDEIKERYEMVVNTLKTGLQITKEIPKMDKGNL